MTTITLTTKELNLLQTALLGFKVQQPELVQKMISELELNIISQSENKPIKCDTWVLPFSRRTVCNTIPCCGFITKDFTGLNPCYNLSDTLR